MRIRESKRWKLPSCIKKLPWKRRKWRPGLKSSCHPTRLSRLHLRKKYPPAGLTVPTDQLQTSPTYLRIFWQLKTPNFHKMVKENRVSSNLEYPRIWVHLVTWTARVNAFPPANLTETRKFKTLSKISLTVSIAKKRLENRLWQIITAVSSRDP